MQQIEIDFEVFKELTARRTHEAHSCNDVMRELLGLQPTLGKSLGDAFAISLGIIKRKSFALRDGHLPHGTELRAVYKGAEYLAHIDDGCWLDDDGLEHSSPSSAASAISNTNVNGLRFWHAKRPGDRDFVRLDILMAKSR